MSYHDIGMLVRLSDSGQTVADPTGDIRGRPVFDESDGRLGTVEDLLVDSNQRRIRFLRVVRGGVLGLGVTPCYVPTSAVIHAGAAVLVRTFGGPTHDCPGYDPALTSEPRDVGIGYEHLTYWVPGYFPPTLWRRGPDR